MPYSDLLRGRASIGWQIYLVTTATHGRTPLFADLHLGRIVVRALHRPAIAISAATLSYVVMPDHLHWLVQLHPQRALSSVVRAVKGSSALEINRVRRTQGPVWQVGFHDHGLRREEDLQDVARYVVCNPVRAGLVRRVNDYSLWDAVWVGESG
ncbi:MAG TPA: transposase [Steroidobacteraceae bacterium]|nr:transposase [Steroidobacteraceae bacterium]